jgi:drug/metabolite transporter (DMT)-like permease
MEDQQIQNKLGAILLSAGGVVLFSAKAVFVKMAYAYDIDTVPLLLVRLLIAMPIYMVIVAVSFSKWRKKYTLKPSHLLIIAGLGLGGYYFASYLDFTGLKYVSAGVERLILFVYPTMVVGLSAIINRKRIPEKQMFALLVTYFGVFLIFFQGILFQDQNNLLIGGMLIISCAFVYACFMIVTEKLIPYTGSIQITCYTLMVSCLAVIIHFLLGDHPEMSSLPSEVFWIGGGMAVFSTVIPSFMIAEAVKRLSASHVAIIGSIGPFTTILLAAIFLGERITAFQGMGAVVIISGVLLVNSGREKIFNRTKREERIQKA